MKTFKENLIRFCKESYESEETIAELAGLRSEELDFLKTKDLTSDIKNILYRFCVGCDVDISSIYSDDGFQMVSLKDQYNEYPTQLKKIISRLFCKQLIKTYCAGSESQFKVFLKLTKIGSQIISRVITGSSCFSPADFDEVFTGMSKVATEAECKQLLAKCMYSLIPNYNFGLGHEYFKVSYSQLSTVLGVTASAISNWGSIGAVPMPWIYYGKLAECLGGFSVEEFVTKILSMDDFKGRSLNLNIDEVLTIEKNQMPWGPVINVQKSYVPLSDTFIDPPTDEPAVPAEEVKQPTKSTEKKKKTKRSKTKPAKQRKPKSRQIAPSAEVIQEVSSAEIPNPRTSTINITDEMITKMYNRLHTSDKMKVNSLIIELFFAQL